MQIGNRIVTRMDDGVTELPFIPHLKVIGRLGSQRKQFHRCLLYTSAPGGIVRESLHCLLAAHRTRFRVIIHQMIRGIILSLIHI